jgi:hypothetical protein
MNIDEFNEWIEGLDLQTLTDELKREILERVRDLHEDAQSEGYGEGYSEAKHEIIDHITFKM